MYTVNIRLRNYLIPFLLDLSVIFGPLFTCCRHYIPLVFGFQAYLSTSVQSS